MHSRDKTKMNSPIARIVSYAQLEISNVYPFYYVEKDYITHASVTLVSMYPCYVDVYMYFSIARVFLTNLVIVCCLP